MLVHNSLQIFVKLMFVITFYLQKSGQIFAYFVANYLNGEINLSENTETKMYIFDLMFYHTN